MERSAIALVALTVGRDFLQQFLSPDLHFFFCQSLNYSVAPTGPFFPARFYKLSPTIINRAWSHRFSLLAGGCYCVSWPSRFPAGGRHYKCSRTGNAREIPAQSSRRAFSAQQSIVTANGDSSNTGKYVSRFVRDRTQGTVKMPRVTVGRPLRGAPGWRGGGARSVPSILPLAGSQGTFALLSASKWAQATRKPAGKCTPLRRGTAASQAESRCSAIHERYAAARH